jgi:glyoxylase-like metal-dependent hydrolase (beta-lactamase superfamily II)
VEILPSIHRLEFRLGDRIVCICVVRAEQETLVFDTGISGSPTEILLPYLEQYGIAPASIRYIVASHADFDHIGGNHELSEAAPDAELLCHAEDRAQIESVETLIRERYGEFVGEFGMPPDPATDDFVRAATRVAPVDRLVQAGEQLHLGDTHTLDVLHLPGHSRGHLGLYEPETRCALISDAVLADALPTADGGAAFPPTYRYTDDYLATIDRLESLPIDVLITGHFPVLRGDEVRDFWHTSRRFASALRDGILDELVGSATSTPQLVEKLAPRLGSWPESSGALLIYPLVGHLEQLEGERLVERDHTSDGTAIWNIVR